MVSTDVIVKFLQHLRNLCLHKSNLQFWFACRYSFSKFSSTKYFQLRDFNQFLFRFSFYYRLDPVVCLSYSPYFIFPFSKLAFWHAMVKMFSFFYRSLYIIYIVTLMITEIKNQHYYHHYHIAVRKLGAYEGGLKTWLSQL